MRRKEVRWRRVRRKQTLMPRSLRAPLRWFETSARNNVCIIVMTIGIYLFIGKVFLFHTSVAARSSAKKEALAVSDRDAQTLADVLKVFTVVR